MDLQQYRNNNLIIKVYSYDIVEGEQKFVSLLNFICLFAYEIKEEGNQDKQSD